MQSNQPVGQQQAPPPPPQQQQQQQWQQQHHQQQSQLHQPQQNQQQQQPQNNQQKQQQQQQQPRPPAKSRQAIQQPMYPNKEICLTLKIKPEDQRQIEPKQQTILLKKIMQKTNTKIEVNSSEDGTLNITIFGKPGPERMAARNMVAGDLQTKFTQKIEVSKYIYNRLQGMLWSTIQKRYKTKPEIIRESLSGYCGLKFVGDKRDVDVAFQEVDRLLIDLIHEEERAKEKATELSTSSNPTSENHKRWDCDINENSNHTAPNSGQRVFYPFMILPEFDFNGEITMFDTDIRDMLSDINNSRCKETRYTLMEELMQKIYFDDGRERLNPIYMDKIGECLASIVVEDFSTRIFPTNISNGTKSGKPKVTQSSLDESLRYPLFLIMREALLRDKDRSHGHMTMLVRINKHFQATGFLLLYFLKVIANHVASWAQISGHYLLFCGEAKREPLDKVLYEDLSMAVTYDPDLYCFILPSVFGDLACCGSFSVTGNIDLIYMMVSNIDPVHLHKMVCLCLTGTAKVINKEDVLPLIEKSLSWESWEQYCIWRLITAQNVPLENYLGIISKLETKDHPEAMSSILLNLQKVTEPTIGMLQTLINYECEYNDLFVTSILRYWSIRTDVHDLARLITSLVDSKPTSPPVKRKGNLKNAETAPTSLSPQTEKILYHLDSIRRRAPKNKLLTSVEILEMLSELEVQCNPEQKETFQHLFKNKPKTVKRQKKTE